MNMRVYISFPVSISRNSIAGSYSIYFFIFWGNHTVSIVAAPIYNPTNSVHEFPFLRITCQCLLFLVSLIMAILTGVRCGISLWLPKVPKARKCRTLWFLGNISPSVQHRVQYTGYPQNPGSPLKKGRRGVANLSGYKNENQLSVHTASTMIYTQLKISVAAHLESSGGSGGLGESNAFGTSAVDVWGPGLGSCERSLSEAPGLLQRKTRLLPRVGSFPEWLRQ